MDIALIFESFITAVASSKIVVMRWVILSKALRRFWAIRSVSQVRVSR